MSPGFESVDHRPRSVEGGADLAPLSTPAEVVGCMPRGMGPSSLPRAVAERLQGSVARHAVVYGAGKVVPAASALATIAVLSRGLGAEQFGRYVLAASLALFWANVGSTWLAQSVVRYQTRFQRARLLSSGYSAFTRRGLWWSAGIAGGGAAIAATMGRATLALWLGSAALACVESIGVVLIATNQARVRPGTVVAFECTKATLGLGAMVLVLAVTTAPTASLVVWAGAAGGGIAALIFHGTSMGPRSGPPRSSAVRAVRGAMLRFGAPIAVFSLLSYALNVADRFLIAHWKGVAAAGSYAAVYDISYRAVSLFVFPVMLSAHPLVTRAWNARDRAGARHAMRTALLMELAIGVPLVLALAASHRYVVWYALGGTLERSFELVLTVSLAALLWQVAQVVHKPSELSGRLGILVGGICLALVVNVLGNVLLLPRAPYLVAGYTSALGTLTYLVFVWMRQRSETR